MPDEKVMREVLLKSICNKMATNKKLFFLTDDFGSIALDKIRNDFKDRFINVGIAEQNLVNISIGLALEGFVVFAYGIAPFIIMRACEQIRNLSMLSQVRKLNVNLIGVGAGLSYDMSGPTHHCLEDVSVVRVFPNIEVFSPSDWVLVEKFSDYSVDVIKPKYIRLDGKPVSKIYSDAMTLDNGFSEIRKGKKICLVSTGYMTHVALQITEELSNRNIHIGLIDMFLLKYFNHDLLYDVLKNYTYILTLEEGFIHKSGMDCAVANLLAERDDNNIKLKKFGFDDKYVFDNGDREHLHKLNHLGKENIISTVEKLWKQ